MRHVWTVLCDSVSADEHSKEVSLLRVREAAELTTGEIPLNQAVSPFPLAQMQVATLRSRSDLNTPESGSARVTVVYPEGKTAGLIEQDIDLTEYRRVRTIGIIAGMQIDAAREGLREIVFRVEARDSSDWRVVAEVPFEVSVIRSSDFPPAATELPPAIAEI